MKALTGGRGVDLAVDPVGGALLIACLHALAPLGMAVSYNIVGGPPAADVFGELRKLLGRSLAVRVFSMHTFDADAQRRRALMGAAIDALASGTVRAPRGRGRPPRATVLPLHEAQRAHELLDAPDTTGKLVLHP